MGRTRTIARRLIGSGLILHIATADDWSPVERARASYYQPAGFEVDGFVHCSRRHQVVGVANERFHGRTDLVLLSIDESMLSAPLRYENLEGGDEVFPHVYGPINMGAVTAALRWEPGPDGTFTSPGLPGLPGS
jgi:uncharacterized protein (DUF952 family)